MRVSVGELSTVGRVADRGGKGLAEFSKNPFTFSSAKSHFWVLIGAYGNFSF
jgi:hypothetical protein